MKRLLTAGLMLILSLMLLACGASAEKPGATPENAAEQTEKAAETAAEATEAPTEAPTPEPTPEPTEEPTPEPTAEPEYWKYVLLRDELKGSYATTQEAWAAMMKIYNLEQTLDPHVSGMFLVNWDTKEYEYSYRLDGIVKEFLYMAETEAYATENNEAVCRALYEPENAEAVAPGVIKVSTNRWLSQLPQYPPVYFISLESEDPASGCWIAAYQDVSENVLHPASVTGEKLAELEKAVNEKKVADLPLAFGGEMFIQNGKTYAIVDSAMYKACMTEGIYKYYGEPANWVSGPATWFPVIDKAEEQFAEAEEQGWAWKADSIEELAEKLNLPALPETVKKYNEYCESGVDEEFGKDAAMLKSVAEGPFYAFEYEGAAWCTIGGLKCDSKLRVITADSKVIDGLYVGGLDAGSLYTSPYYDGPGSAVGLACGSGILAAECILEYIG